MLGSRLVTYHALIMNREHHDHHDHHLRNAKFACNTYLTVMILHRISSRVCVRNMISSTEATPLDIVDCNNIDTRQICTNPAAKLRRRPFKIPRLE